MKEPTQKELDRFAKWCAERYSERTTKKLVCDARTVCRYGGVPPHAKLKTKLFRGPDGNLSGHFTPVSNREVGLVTAAALDHLMN